MNNISSSTVVKSSSLGSFLSGVLPVALLGVIAWISYPQIKKYLDSLNPSQAINDAWQGLNDAWLDMIGQNKKSPEQMQNEVNDDFEANKTELIDWLNSGGADWFNYVNQNDVNVPIGDNTGVYYDPSEWMSIHDANKNEALLNYNPVTGGFDLVGGTGGGGIVTKDYNEDTNVLKSAVLQKNDSSKYVLPNTVKYENDSSLVFPDFSEQVIFDAIKDNWDPENGSAENAAKFLAEKTEQVAGRYIIDNPGISNAGEKLYQTVYQDGSFEVRTEGGQIISSGSPGSVGAKSPSQKAQSESAYHQKNVDKMRSEAAKGGASGAAAIAWLERYSPADVPTVTETKKETVVDVVTKTSGSGSRSGSSRSGSSSSGSSRSGSSGSAGIGAAGSGFTGRSDSHSSDSKSSRDPGYTGHVH